MEVMPGYKQTEVGVIPGEWGTVRLADISAFITKGSTPTTYGFGWQSSGVLFLRSECVSPKGLDLAQSMFIATEAHRTLRRSAVHSNDLLITITGNVGRVVKVPEGLGEANINQHIARIRIVDESTHADWAYHFLSQPVVRRHFEKITTGQAYPQISLVQVRDAVIPRPVIAEQRAIAAALSDVDALLGGLDRLIAKKRDLKQAAMQQLLTGQTRLPGFSGQWEVRRLGEIADVLKGSALSKSLVAVSGAHPCILYGELFTTYGRVIANVVSRTNSSEGCRSMAGDVLLPGSTTTTGADLATATALLIEDVALGGDIIIVRRKGKSHDPVFLASCLTHTAKHEIAELTQGITIHHLYGKDLKTLSLHLPSLSEQTAIAAVLSDMDAELAALEARRDKTRDLKQAMMQELLTGKTRLVKPEAAHA